MPAKTTPQLDALTNPYGYSEMDWARVIQFSGMGLHNSSEEGKEFCPTRGLACPARSA